MAIQRWGKNKVMTSKEKLMNNMYNRGFEKIWNFPRNVQDVVHGCDYAHAQICVHTKDWDFYLTFRIHENWKNRKEELTTAWLRVEVYPNKHTKPCRKTWKPIALEIPVQSLSNHKLSR